MKNKSIRFCSSISFCTLAAIGFVAFFLLGCSSLKVESFKIKSLDNREQKILNTGYEAFTQADYEEASHIFNSLYQTGSNGVIRRRALYGLACTRLLTARNTIQFDEAVTLWNTWVNSAPDEFAPEDPRLLCPFIQKSESPCKKEEEIQLLNKKIDLMQKETKTLKHQIKTIEEIDQKIEEKKREILSP
ncbi:MAG: hypothetical protein HF978_21100 [Desulfobacteraceae bacterium]|nr:hypothetical protein [Desulfobacteraceae bacterium]MBC2758048.1 hypothetical protein [Desulfobacteraceae bacterium]